MDPENVRTGQLRSNGEQVEAVEFALYDIIMTEYSGYTLYKIENELTYEQLYMMIDTIVERLKKRASNKGQNNINVENYDIEDIADGKTTASGFSVDKKVVH